MAANMTTGATLVHQTFSKELTDLTTDAFPLASFFDDDSDSVKQRMGSEWSGNGREFREGLVVGTTDCSCFVPEIGGGAPDPGDINLQELVINLKYAQLTIGATRQLYELSKGGKATAYKERFALENSQRVKMWKRKKERTLVGNGTGRLCQTSAAVGVGLIIIPVHNPNGQVSVLNGAKLMVPGRKIVIADAADAAILSVHTVVRVIAPGTSIEVTPATTVAIPINVNIYEAPYQNLSVLASSAKNNETMGLGGIVTDQTGLATYFGLSRALFPQLNATVVTGIGALTQSTIDSGFNVLQITGEDMVDPDTTCLVMDHDTRTSVLALGQALMRLPSVQQIKNPDIGTNALANKLPTTNGGFRILATNYMDKGTILIFNKSGAKKVIRKSGFVDDVDGGMWHGTLNVDGHRSFEKQATYESWEAFYHTNPRSCVRLSGITTGFTYASVY